MGMMTLDQYLKAEKISQRAFAGVVDLSPSYLNEIIHGVKVPPLAAAYRIERATAGKVPMAALLPQDLRVPDLIGEPAPGLTRGDPAACCASSVEAPAQGRGVGEGPAPDVIQCDENQKGAA